MSDEQAIRAVALDYIEGWYEADAGRMDRALAPYLAKRRVVSAVEIWDIDKAWMVSAAQEGRGKLEEPENGRREVTLLDRTGRMASVTVVAEAFTDYPHLAKTGDSWSIVNVLWDFHEEQSSTPDSR